MKYTCYLIFVALTLVAQTGSDGPQFTPSGELLLPKNYREWVFLSSGLGMTYGPAAQSNNPMFDNVFVNPSSYRAFLETGRWPDRTMFMLEIRRAVEKASINNGGRTQGDVVALEAAVKDEKRFPQKWAYFGFGESDKATARPANSTCNACHGQNAAVENSFVQFYPVLLEVATRKGTLNPSYAEKATKH
jgi:Cytochrome P460